MTLALVQTLAAPGEVLACPPCLADLISGLVSFGSPPTPDVCWEKGAVPWGPAVCLLEGAKCSLGLKKCVVLPLLACQTQPSVLLLASQSWL